MGDHDDGLAQLADDPVEQVQDDGGRVGVEVAGGFVGQHQGGIVDQRAGDGDPLLLASGEAVGKARSAVGQADTLEQALAPARGPPRRRGRSARAAAGGSPRR